MEDKNFSESLKVAIKDFWNERTCGTWNIKEEKYTREYFDAIEEERYNLQPEIFSFAQFSRYRGKKVLEVGIGAGTDFIQWVRSGAFATGIDLTDEAIKHTQIRLSLENLNCEQLLVSDCESLPFPDNSFDLVYSWGVIHHTPNTENALKEIIRVCKPGGECKIMVYHRNSLLAFFFWIKYALLKGKFWKSKSWVLYNYMESIGTKAFTKKEIYAILKDQPIKDLEINTILSYYDKLSRFNKFFRFCAKAFAYLLGKDKVGWFLTFRFRKA